VSRRSRIIGFGSAALLAVAGVVCAVILHGLGEILAVLLIGLGFVLATSLLFLEVGFSEDRERAREDAARVRKEEKQRSPHRDAGGRPGQSPLERRRGRPRRRR
jgi:hypothetical protein